MAFSSPLVVATNLNAFQHGAEPLTPKCFMIACDHVEISYAYFFFAWPRLCEDLQFSDAQGPWSKLVLARDSTGAVSSSVAAQPCQGYVRGISDLTTTLTIGQNHPFWYGNGQGPFRESSPSFCPFAAAGGGAKP